jgi:phage gpG-like protein
MAGGGWLRFDFSSSKLDSLREQLESKASRLHEVLFTKVQALTLQLQTKVIGKLSGDVLRVRTGILRGSVNTQTTTDGTKITGTVSSSGGPAFYGRIHESGVPHAWQITAVKSRALAFQLGPKAEARKIFAKHVTHPAMAARPFMSTTLEENRQAIIDELAAEVARVLREK